VSLFAIIVAATFLVVAFAAARGDAPEKLCAAIIAAEALIDLVLQFTIGPRSFVEFYLSRLLLDLFAASALIAVAMRANRLYPLAIAAAQLVAVIGSISALVARDGWSQAFWAMTQLPVVLQLALLLGGTVMHRYRLSRVGPYNSWSPPQPRHVQPG